MKRDMKDLVIYTGNPAWELPKLICQQIETKFNLEFKLGIIELTHFPDGEQRVRYPESIREKHLVIINENTPANNLFLCLQMIDAAQRANVGEITMCNPYFGWLRQDRQKKGREAVNAKMAVNYILNYPPKVRGLLTMDNHFKQATSLTDKPWDQIYSASYFINKILSYNKEATTISPDLGGINTVNYIANKLNYPMGFIRKVRTDQGVQVIEVVRTDEKTVAFIIDDIAATFDTGGKTIEALVNKGINEIFFLGTHGVLAGDAITNINKLPLGEVFVTNTVFIPEEKKRLCPKLKIISVHDIFAEVISRIHIGESISELIDPKLRESY